MNPPGLDDVAPKDPKAAQQTRQEFTEQDFEGHRAAMFIGVHLPGQKKHRRHHRHKNKNKNDDEEDEEEERPSPRLMMRRRSSRLGSFTDDGEWAPPSQRVQFILGEDGDNDSHESHPLFSEMEELIGDGDSAEWKETARWIKFEEDVEEGGNRWSKPHVATLSLHSLFELRSLILNGTVILDMEGLSLEQIVDNVLDNIVSSGSLEEHLRDKVHEVLMRKHRHQHERRKETSSRLPIIRSLAEIGRNHSSSKKSVSSQSSDTELTVRRSASDPSSKYCAQPPTTYGSFLTVPGIPGVPGTRNLPLLYGL